MWFRLLVVLALTIHVVQIRTRVSVKDLSPQQKGQLEFTAEDLAFQSILKELGIVHPLILRTKKESLIPCENVIDYSKLVNEVIECSNKNIYPEKPIEQFTVPKCFIIPITSPDVLKHESGEYNYITLNFTMAFEILGFYEAEDNTMYIVETFDQEMTTKHEIQHAILHQQEGHGDARHIHKIWDECERGFYEPSLGAMKAARESREADRK